MFQFAFVALLFAFKYRNPSFVPLLQLPNRRATAPKTPPRSPVNFLRCGIRYFSPGGIVALPRPQTPYAATPTGGRRRMATPRYQPAPVALLSAPKHRNPSFVPL